MYDRFENVQEKKRNKEKRNYTFRNETDYRNNLIHLVNGNYGEYFANHG